MDPNVAKLWHDVGFILKCPEVDISLSVQVIEATMYKPLSLVINKAGHDLERHPVPGIYALVSNDESRNNTRRREVLRAELIEQDTRKQGVAVKKQNVRERSVTVQNLEPTFISSSPRCIRSYRSDRVAIYNEINDTFHAYSITEAISQPGLSFEQAVDWVDDRLVLVGKGMSPKNFTVAMSLIMASWVVALLLVYTAIQFIF